ncbi:MAG: cytochrome c oxidase subunit 3 [Planctomycetales bacterium]|nr:cytochrome c oxidase subunit 3 [Planctomycetales bacterium]
MTRPTPQMQTRIALRFLLLACGLIGAGGLLAWLLLCVWPPQRLPRDGKPVTFPIAFHFSTAWLIAVSVALHGAWTSVRIEKQPRFRRCLRLAIVFTTLFIGVQTFGLAQFVASLPRDSYHSSTGPGAFVFVFAVLHALHVGVASLFLAWVTVSAFADRYDHEYCWGVTFCAFFWHALGVVWLAILATFAITSGELISIQLNG